jgi:hypothetical protein
LRRVGVGRTSGALPGRVDVSGARRTTAGSGASDPAVRPESGTTGSLSDVDGPDESPGVQLG